MLHVMDYPILAELTERNDVFLWSESVDGRLFPTNEWAPLLLQWDPHSFYGSHVTPYKRHGKEGVFLPAWHATELFANEYFNTLVDWKWNEQAEVMLSTAPVLKEAIHSLDLAPHQEGEQVIWQVPERIWSEFPDSHWQRHLPETLTKSGGQTIQDFVTKWYQQAAQTWLESYDRFSALQEALSDRPEERRRAMYYFDRTRFQQWVGETDDPLPFTLGLRLEDPSQDGVPWELHTFLQTETETIEFSRELPSAFAAHEEAVKEELTRWCRVAPYLDNKKGGIVTQLTEDEAWQFLTSESELFLALGVEILLPSWWQQIKDAQLRLKADVKDPTSGRKSFVGLDAMVQFDWRIAMNGVEFSEDQFRSLVEQKRRLVNWNGQWVKLDPAFIERIQALMKEASEEGIHVRDVVERHLLGEEANTVDNEEDILNQIDIRVHHHFDRMIRQLQKVEAVPELPVPATLEATLRPYQQRGMSWLLTLREYGFGACLADDMGLGKTVQLISYLLTVKEHNKHEGKPSLIIAPTSVIGNWQRELARFSPSLSCGLHYGTRREKGENFGEFAKNHDVIITTYGLVQNDQETLQLVDWDAVVLDEAQNIKNAETKQSRAVRNLKGTHHIALTGTPIENRLMELWSIFDFLNHGYLGSKRAFANTFVKPIEGDNDEERLAMLRKLVSPFLLRRRKTDEAVSLSLPEKQEQKEYVQLTAEQAALYAQLVEDTMHTLQTVKGMQRKGLILKLLGKLKQLCNHPAIYLKENEAANIIDRSEKIKKLVDYLDMILEEKESSLIFTQYIGMGKLLQRVLYDRYKLEVPFLNGSVPKAKRDDWIASFQENEFPIFLLSLKAGGTGLNLTAANHVFHVDRWWNPAVENQATDRAYRIGQKRFVQVHKFITTGTLEEKVDRMLTEKQALNDQVLEKGEHWVTELSDDELHALFRLDN